MRRYAFIDIQNTETTAIKVLNFNIDHAKLLTYLSEKWQCEKVFFYPGIEYGDQSRENTFKALSDRGAVVRVKHYFVYKNKDKTIPSTCLKCAYKNTYVINMGYTWKCNCDVEMTMDILEHAARDIEMLIFTGDGDFAFLLEKILKLGVKVYLVSSARKISNGSASGVSRFSIKLKKLLSLNSPRILFIDMDDWKMRIQKAT